MTPGATGASTSTRWVAVTTLRSMAATSEPFTKLLRPVRVHCRKHQGAYEELHKPKTGTFRCPVDECRYMDATVNKAMFVRHLSTHPGVCVSKPPSSCGGCPSRLYNGVTHRAEGATALELHRTRNRPTAAETFVSRVVGSLNQRTEIYYFYFA